MRRKKKAVEERSNDKWKGDQKGEIKRGRRKAIEKTRKRQKDENARE